MAKKPQGIPNEYFCFDEDEYPNLISALVGKHYYPETYDDWLKRKHVHVRELEGEGHLVTCYHVSVRDFIAWCKLHGYEINQANLSKYINENFRYFRKMQM